MWEGFNKPVRIINGKTYEIFYIARYKNPTPILPVGTLIPWDLSRGEIPEDYCLAQDFDPSIM